MKKRHIFVTGLVLLIIPSFFIFNHKFLKWADAHNSPMATSTPAVDLYGELQALAERRTLEAMKDPKNIKAYHDQLFNKEMKAINILSTTEY